MSAVGGFPQGLPLHVPRVVQSAAPPSGGPTSIWGSDAASETGRDPNTSPDRAFLRAETLGGP